MVPASLPAWKPPGLSADATRSNVAWASLTFLIPAIVSLLSKMGSIDLAYHLRAGEDVLHGNIPRVDTYTFTVPGPRGSINNGSPKRSWRSPTGWVDGPRSLPCKRS